VGTGRGILMVAVAGSLVVAAAGPAAAQGATTQRVSVSTAGEQANKLGFGAAISADGRYVAFSSEASNLVPGDTNGTSDVFVRDLGTGATSRVSVSGAGDEANNESFGAAISADGQHVAFLSEASNLVSGDTNAKFDVFVRDLGTGSTSRVSVSTAGEQANDHSYDLAISADGRYVAFSSEASNLVPGDTNGTSDVFVRDRVG
jgi:Tol biopolymer transport system component